MAAAQQACAAVAPPLQPQGSRASSVRLDSQMHKDTPTVLLLPAKINRPKSALGKLWAGSRRAVKRRDVAV